MQLVGSQSVEWFVRCLRLIHWDSLIRVIFYRVNAEGESGVEIFLIDQCVELMLIMTFGGDESTFPMALSSGHCSGVIFMKNHQ